MKKLSESIWGDVQRRGMGVQTKKEDDVNNMDMDMLCDYLRKTLPKYSKSCKSIMSYIIPCDRITIHILMNDYICEIELGSFDMAFRSLTVDRLGYDKFPKSCKDKLNNLYHIGLSKDYASIHPDLNSYGGTNEFCVNVIKLILDYADKENAS